MESLGQRLNAAIDASGLSPADVARLAKTTGGQISQWANDKVQAENIKADVLERICSVLGVRPRWMLYGEPPMRPETDESVDWVSVRMGTGVAAGAGQDDDAVIGGLKFRRSSLARKNLFPENLGVFFVNGDSMAPTLRDGSVVLYDATDKWPIRPGKIYVIRWRGGRAIKRLREYDGRMWISSDNKADPEWRDDVPVNPETDDFEVIGRYRWGANWED